MSTPSVPPRPQRTQAAYTSVENDTPLVPPRPARQVDPSPDREAYTRSPLNAPPTASSNRQIRPRTSQDLPQRPPSVSLPDIGQEGAEYDSFDQLPPEAHGVVVDPPKSVSPGEQTRNVSADLPMHQPKASVPRSTAKRQIQGVTGTDSTQAAAAGIGRARPADDVHKLPPGDAPLSRVTTNDQPTKRAPSTELGMRAGYNRSASSLQPLERTTSRPGSVHGGEEYEHGIPEIGRQVPLLAMAGDVQAPSPGQNLPQHTPGIGFFNDGSGKHKKRGSRQEFGPPDAYGLHHSNQDQFEKEWVRKHPREAAKEEYYHHLPKPETALTSEQLNRLVHSESTPLVGTPGTPDEHDADEYLSRLSSAQGSPAPDRKKRSSSGADAASPFNKTFGINERNRLHPDDALDSEDDLTGQRRASRIVDEDHEHEHADGTPILAADELMKRPGSAFMHAAVTPDPDAHHDEYGYESDTGSRRGSLRPNSRPSSRPSSVHGVASSGYHGGPLHRFVSREEEHHSGMGTPLEEIEEYEPLFPEGEGENKGNAKRIFKKRPELAQHHFPSRDVWEDTPSSLQYSAEVSTPEMERSQAAAMEEATKSASSTFETPEQEMQRRGQNARANDMTSDSKTFVKPHFKPGVADEVHRPLAHRFPSSDVWEDSPDSYTLVNQTTVSPDIDEASAKPSIPARPQRQSKLGEEIGDRDLKSPPSVPAKPSVPARPLRASKPDQLEGTSLERSGDAAAAVKAKPPVPARPGGGKFGAQAGFLADLNNRLKVGPQGLPPKKEVEPELDEETARAPLADARKSRVKGPQRRKPAAAPTHDRKSSITFAFSPLINCWSIDEEDELTVHQREEERKEKEKEKQQQAPTSGAAAPEAERILKANELVNVESTAPIEHADAGQSSFDAHEIARSISTSDQPGTEARQHRESGTELKAALAKAGAAPTSYGAEEAIAEEGERGAGTKEQSVQTGETAIKIPVAGGGEQTLKAFVGAKAPEEGNVVMKDDDA